MNKTGTAAANKLTGTNAADKLFGLGGNDQLFGLGGVDTLDGSTGNDTLDGGAGNDKLIGGTGNDTYIVTATSGTDQFLEKAANGGTDTIVSSRSSFTLGTPTATANHIENLTLTGSAITGIGNSLNNVIRGTTGNNKLSGAAGNDTLDGGAGNDSLNGGAGGDSMKGGAGNDTYVVDAPGDKVVGEAAGGGTDLVQSSITFTLGGTGLSQVENLTLTGTGNINGTGNALANTIIGNAHNNVLNGGTGAAADKLDGGAGNDTLDGAGGADSVVGGAGDDTLIYDAADVKLDGGADIDTLQVSGGVTVNLTDNAAVTGIEIVSLVTGDNTLAIEAQRVLDLVGDTLNTLRIDGGAGDVVNSPLEDWTLTGQETIVGAGVYNVYDSDLNDAVLKIQQGIAFHDLNHAPETSDVTASVAENATVTGTVADNTTDDDGANDTQTFSVVGSAPAGLTFATNGAFSFDAGAFDSLDAGASTTVAFQYQSSDGHLDSNASTVTLTVTGVNDAPDAVNDSASVLEDASVTGSVAGNDTDADASHAFSYSMAGTPGGLAFASDGTYTFDAGAFDSLGAGQTMSVVASYTLSDGNATDSATLTITVTGANDTPSAVADSAGVLENGTVTGSVAGNDVLGDGANTWALLGSVPGLAFASSGAYTFDAGAYDSLAANATTSVLASYTLTDADGESSSAVLAITITGENDAPVAGDDTASVTENNSIAGSVAGNDTDADAGHTFSFSMTGTPGGLSFASDGTYAFNAGAFDSLGAGETATVTATYTLSDGTATDGATLAITVTGANDAPVDAVPGAQSTSLLDNLAITGVSVADVDIGADDITVQLSTDLGALSLGQTTGLVFTAGDGAEDGSMTFSGAIADVNAALGTLVLNATQAGSGTITIQSHDADSGADTDTIGVSVSSVVDMATLDGANGLRLTGIDAYDRSGRSVASAGDFDGDGLSDVVIGAFGADVGASQAAGQTYVLFGQSAGFGSALSLGALDGTNGIALAGINLGDNSGYSVASAGDVNGDGFDDLVIGALGAGVSEGRAFVVFGGTGFGTGFSLSTLDGANGFRLDGVDLADRTGWSVASAGDMNDDGYDDVIVGAAWADGQAGDSYVVFGKASGFAPALALSALNGTNGFRLDGTNGYDRSGYSVASAGDFNGDGYDDAIVGAWHANSYAGASYVVFGKADGFASALALGSLGGTDGFVLDGAANDNSGCSVASAGDVNGDGYGDLVIGARRADGFTGASYVVFGRPSGYSGLALTALGGSNGFKITGANALDQNGVSVASAGDFNGDGYDDLIVTSRIGDQTGASYVVFGKATGFSDVALSALDGTNGFSLSHGTEINFGLSAASAGDVDGDGYDDLVIGAQGGSTSAGESFIIFGADVTGAVDFAGTPGIDLPIGTALAEVFVAGLGNDIISGGGGADVVRAGGGDDAIIIGDGAFADIDGGTGTDRLALGGNMVLDLTAIADSKLTGIEIIDLTTGNHVLTLDEHEVKNIADTGNTLRVTGDGADSVVAVVDPGAGRWVQGGTINDAGTDYTVFTRNGATLEVQAGVNVAGIPVYDAAMVLSEVNGVNGVRLVGTLGSDHAGRSVASAGDVNGDGYDDVIVGAESADIGASNTGAAYVVFGGSGLAASIDLSAMNGTNGFRLGGAAANDNAGGSIFSGNAVSSAGDVNGDGLADVMVGAYRVNSVAGATYVVFGSTSFAGSIGLGSLDGTNGFRLDGVSGDRSAEYISLAGDVNADGYGDLLVGAWDNNRSYVVYGGSSFASSMSLGSLDGTNGFVLNGEGVNTSGRGVGAAGDVNGDGYGDLIIGDYDANYQVGRAYVVFGGPAIGASVSLGSLDGATGLIVNGLSFGDKFGSRVSSAGDVNGDGFGDIVIGARRGDPTNSGDAYVIFGGTSSYLDTLNGATGFNVANLNGTNGFRLDGGAAGDYAGIAVASAGDFNGDGYDDVIIGASTADPGGRGTAGASYVIFGGSSFNASYNLGQLDGANGFRLEGIELNDNSGFSVASAGDVNGDGFDDLIVGAWNAEVSFLAFDTGESYIIYGGAVTGEVVHLGTSASETLNGTAAAETFVAGDGNDTIDSGGGADVIRGGAGDDRIVLGADLTVFDIDGGNGQDTLAVTGETDLDLTGFQVSTVGGIERVDLVAGTGTNSLTLTVHDLLNLSDTSNTLTVDGDSSDSFNIDGNWTSDGTQGVYSVYVNTDFPTVKLLLDSDIVNNITL